MSAFAPLQVAVLTIGCFLGGAAGSFLYAAASPKVANGPSGAVAAPPARSQEDVAELLGELRALREELERGKDARSRAEPAADERVGTSRERELVEQLRALIESAQAPDGLTRPTEAESVQRPSVNGLAGLRATVGVLPVDSGLVEQLDAAQRRLLEGHLLWTLRDVVEHYGKPEQVQGGESGIFLRYRYGDPPMWFRFMLVDGFVVHVSVEGGT